MQYDAAMIGLGTMGRNLILNMADNNFSVIGFDANPATAALLLPEANHNPSLAIASSLEEMVSKLKTPRRIFMLVPAGKIVDDVLSSLSPFLEKEDIVVDSGNSFYQDTERRVAEMQQLGIHFVGMGISGGEMGARFGPSIMPGGDKNAWPRLQPLLEAVSAKVNGEPCVAYMGNKAAGHYVKMVHNGIEYAIMQLISEVYDVLKHGAKLSNQELHAVFAAWNANELQSFLMEITAKVFLKKDAETNNDLVDMILDRAGSKGTGKWTSQDAMNLPVSIPTIDMAVAMRDLSAFKAQREQAYHLYQKKTPENTAAKEEIIAAAKDALYAATIICYAQGLAMLQQASIKMELAIPMQDVVKIWRGGCIIRSASLNDFYKAFVELPNLQNLLLSPTIASMVTKAEDGLRKFISLAIQQKIAVAASASALGYLDAYTSEKMPVNLIQAQRDFFGAHTYERVDKQGPFHTDWEA